MSAVPSNAEARDGGGPVAKRRSRPAAAAGSPAREPAPVRVALVDDEAAVHRVLRSAFKRFARTWTLDCYLDGWDALVQIPSSPPQIVLMDYHMPRLTGIACARGLQTRLPDLPVIMFSAHVNPDVLLRSMLAGARGCLCKPAEPPDIILAIQRTLNGALTLCPRAEKTLLQCFHLVSRQCDAFELTAREKEILDGFFQERTDKQIADRLRIEPGTVHGHTASIFKKLQVHSRAEAIAKLMNLNQAP
jgi:DNA-binding NarL/FixJ family response regulator